VRPICARLALARDASPIRCAGAVRPTCARPAPAWR